MIFDKSNKEKRELVENKSICRINVIYRKYFESREITCCNKICAIFDIFLILHIYCDNKYSELNQEQACRLQRLLVASCDLFGQSIINHREFDEGYLNHWLNGGAMELEIARLKDKIKKLNQEIEMLQEQQD